MHANSLIIKKLKIYVEQNKSKLLVQVHLHLKETPQMRITVMSSLTEISLCKNCMLFFSVYIFAGLECVGHYFAYVAHL